MTSDRTRLRGPVPIHRTVGVEIGDVDSGRAVVRLAGSPAVGDSNGRMAAGALGIVADACCGTAGATALPASAAALTVQMRLEFAGPMPELSGSVEGRARVDAVTGDSVLVRGEVLDEAGHLVAVCSMRMLSVPVRLAVPAARAPAPSPLPDGAAPADPYELLGVTNRHAGDGAAELVLRPSRGVANSYVALHGGAVAMVAQLTAAAAQRRAVGDSGLVEGLVEPFDLVVNYLRGIPIDGTRLVSAAALTHHGRRFVVAEGQLRRADGRVAARFSSGAQVRTDR